MATKIKLDIKALRAIRSSPAVLADLKRRAEAIAARTGDPDSYHVNAEAHASRARASVVTATYDARYAEATDHVLLGALDAGRH